MIVGDEEAPLVDASMKMNISLMAAVTAMDGYRSATATLSTSDASALQGLESDYLQAVEAFDKAAEAILAGGVLDGGQKVIKTDNASWPSWCGLFGRYRRPARRYYHPQPE